MKHLFVYARYKEVFVLPASCVEVLLAHKRIALCAEVQFINSLQGIAQQLAHVDIQTQMQQGEHSFEYGQTLGCDAPTLDVSKFDAFLYIGDGYFHPKGIVMNNTLPVYIYNPVEQKIALYDRSEVEWMLKRKKAGISSFLMYDCIGLLVSLKSGQNRYVLLDKLKKKFPDKQYYTFIFDSIDYSQLENFPFIQVWVNTACPRIGLDDTNKIVKPVVNIIDLLELKM